MAKLVNNETGKLEDLDADVAQASFLGGTHNLPRSQPVVLKNEYDELVQVDPSEVYQSLTAGKFKIASDADIAKETQRQKFGEAPGSSIKAFGEGALRSATFGVSDVALPALGITTEEALKGRKEENPLAEGAGQVAGFLGTLPIPASPVARLAKVGEAVTKGAAATKALTSLAGKGIVGKALASGAAVGAGSAVEGLAQGAGQIVSEAALGDPDLTAQKAAAQIGFSGLLGGALGGALGTVTRSAARVVGDAPIVTEAGEQVLKASGAGKASTTGRSAINELSVDQAIEDQLANATRFKPDAPEIQAAADRFGAKAFPGMLSKVKADQNAQTLLWKSATPIGIKAEQELAESIGKVQTKIDDAFKTASQLSENEAGQSVRDGLVKRLDAEYQPIKELYDSLGMQSTIPVAEQEVKSLIKTLKGISGLDDVRNKKSFYRGSILRDLDRMANDPAGISIQRLRDYKQQVKSMDPELKYISQVFGEAVDEVEEAAVVRAAKSIKDPVGKSKVEALLTNHNAAKKKYGAFKGKLEELGQKLGLGQIRGAQGFLDALEEKSNEQLAKRLFDNNDVGFINFMKENFPEQFETLVSQQKGRIVAGAESTKGLATNRYLKAIEKLPKEVKQALFTPDQLDDIAAAQVYMKNVPADFNPSGTSGAEGMRRFLSEPWKASTEFVQDFATNTYLNAMNQTQGLSALERAANKTARSVQTAVDRAYDAAMAGYLGSRITKPIIDTRYKFKSEEDPVGAYKGSVSRIAKLSSDPALFAERLASATSSVNEYAPNISQQMQVTAARSLSFLQSKIPVRPIPAKPLSAPYEPSVTEMARFNRYYNTVDKPLSVLQSIEAGTLTKEQVEAVATVYPALYTEMKSKLLEKVTSKKNVVPYRMRMMMSLFMAQDMDDSTTAQSILSFQAAHDRSQMRTEAEQVQSSGKVTQGGLGKLDVASRQLTPAQRSSNRAEV
jgi:hypothetical protein